MRYGWVARNGKLRPRARAGALAALLAVAAAGCASPPPVNPVGVGAGPPAAVRSFEAWRGKPVGYVLDYTFRRSWGDISTPAKQITEWQYDPAHHRLVLSVGMLPDGLGDLASGARGAYDSYFRTLAGNLISHHLGNTIVRLGWEFNGNWNRWGIVKADAASSQRAALDYAAFFRRIVTAMRAVPGGQLTFDWSVNNGYSSISATAAYPGDAYVDYVGVDVYDRAWGPYGSIVSDPAQRWKIISTGYHGLNYWAAFAAQHHKRLSVPEWGLWSGDHGGGDDPTYISGMHAFFVAHQVSYECYFNFLAAGKINTGTFPKAARMYQVLF